MISITISTSSFTNAGAIPSNFYQSYLTQCSGDNDSPQISWSIEGTDETADHIRCLCTDTTLGAGNFVHWNVRDIPISSGSIAENGSWPVGSTVNNNGWTGIAPSLANGWGGPCPPPGPAHTYQIVFQVRNASNVVLSTSNAITFTAVQGSVTPPSPTPPSPTPPSPTPPSPTPPSPTPPSPPVSLPSVVAVTKTGPFYPGSSEITFSSLRDNFKEVGIGSVTASSLLRDAKPTSKNPIVPDSTENAGISSTINWKASQFRPAIKYYNITHTGTETNYDLAASLPWNNNLNKTIVKSIFLQGIYVSTNVDNPSTKLEAEARNVRLYVEGEILGAGGKGGTTSTSITKGGDALSVKSDGNEVTIIPKGSIYGGGGGGAKGATGLQGSSGNCNFYTTYTAPSSCGPKPSCGDDTLISSSSTGSCNCNTFCVEVYYPPPSPPSPPRPYSPPRPPTVSYAPTPRAPAPVAPVPYVAPVPQPSPPRPPSGKKSDIRLKVNIRDLETLF